MFYAMRQRLVRAVNAALRDGSCADTLLEDFHNMDDTIREHELGLQKNLDL